MTKEELFNKFYSKIQTNILDKILSCAGVVDCVSCGRKGEGCSKKFSEDFLIFKRKKKLEKLLS